MCVLFMALEAHPQYRLILATNRDEYYARKTEPMHFWPEYRGILAGRDGEGGGTWFAVGPGVRWGAVTNYRDPRLHRAGARSRGELVPGFLVSGEKPADYLKALHKRSDKYNPFNLLVGDEQKVCFLSSVTDDFRILRPGIHSLSNRHLDTPWPKIVRGTHLFRQLVNNESEIDPEDLLEILQDRAVPLPEHLPDTGIGEEWERALAPIFIQTPEYGTRSSTVLLIEKSGKTTVIERRFDANGETGVDCIEF